MNQREKEIAAVAASVAAGCVKCLKYHKREALAAGMTEDEILRITRRALMIRRKANDFNIGDLDTVLNEGGMVEERSDRASEDLASSTDDSSPCCE